MEQQSTLTMIDILGSTINLLVKNGTPGAASFVGLCYELQRKGQYTVEEVTNLAARFILNEGRTGEVNEQLVESLTNFQALVPPCTDEEDDEWQAIISKPRVQASLRRMAAEARRQFQAGETREGGFGLEQ